MPEIPKIHKNLTQDTNKIMNTIRANSSDNYKNAVPTVNGLSDLIACGQIFKHFPFLANEFLSALYNRIGLAIITSKMYTNPLSHFKKGILQYGESIEEIFVNIARPHKYELDTTTDDIFQLERPDVRTKLHHLNYKNYYKLSTSVHQLERAFLSYNGVTDLIYGIINSAYSAIEYDEFISMKYLIARNILEMNMGVETIPVIDDTNAKSIGTKIKTFSNSFEFMSSQYNQAGVYNFSKKNDQFLISTVAFDAAFSVNVLASSFNMDQAEFLGHRVLIDSFVLSNSENERLAELFGNDPYFKPINTTALNNVAAVIIDRNWLQIYDCFIDERSIENDKSLFDNHFIHVWRVFSTSPFSNAVAFVTQRGTITSITITPTTPTVTAGQSIKFTANVTGTGIYCDNIHYSVNSDISSIDQCGCLYVPTTETDSTLTVTAQSIGDTTKTATATVTIIH